MSLSLDSSPSECRASEIGSVVSELRFEGEHSKTSCSSENDKFLDYEYDKIVRPALKLLVKLNPRKRYLVNVSPDDIRSQKFLLKNGFTGLEYVYEMEIDS